MAKQRICTQCGKVEETESKSLICGDCALKNKKNIKINEEKSDIDKWGYDLVDPEPFLDKYDKRNYHILRRVCGHSYKVRFANLLKGIQERPETTPCAVCGGKERAAKATLGATAARNKN